MRGAVEYRDEDVAGRVGRSTIATDTVFERIRLHGEPVLVTEHYREIDRAMTFSESLSPGERRLRWFIVGWLTLSTILNLINRNTLSIIVPTFSSRFSGVSFTSAANLVAKLRSPPEPVSEYLRSRFSVESVWVLMDGGVALQQQQSVLIEELNKISRGGSIYDAQRFAGVVRFDKLTVMIPETQSPEPVEGLSDGTRKLMAQNPQAESRHPAYDAILRTFQIKS